MIEPITLIINVAHTEFYYLPMLSHFSMTSWKLAAQLLHFNRLILFKKDLIFGKSD